MKKLLICLLLIGAGVANADSITLPEPTVQQLNPAAYCGASITPNETSTLYTRQAITGWSADGTQVFAKTYGSYPCGHSGRGSNITYYKWCGVFTWTITFDDNGNLNPIDVATFTSDPTQCAAPNYPRYWDTGATFYNSFGYGATMTPEPLYYGYYADAATLLTP